MPQFILDHGTPEAARRFAELPEFDRGYITAIFFTDANSDTDVGEASFAELAPETLERINADCRSFNLTADGQLFAAYNRPNYQSAEQAGIDFWLTRNRHGAGFWDRGLGPLGDHLTDIAHSFGSCDLYRGDDGKLYLA